MQATIILTVATLAAVVGAQASTPSTKDQAAGGRYQPSYGGNTNYGGNYGGYQPPLLQDRFVCDLDASVLLVTDSNRHHHRHHHTNRAVRVKCSEVASYDEDSCNLCCQQTARRDTTLANDKLFGFLAVVKGDDDKTFTRTKRSTDDEDEDSDEKEHKGRRFHKVDPTFVNQADWTPDKLNSNVKCVCCAPRASANTGYGGAAQNPPSNNYNNAAQNPPTNYNNAAQNPPTNYNNAAQNPPSSTYGNSNTFSTNPQPAPVTASQPAPLVDGWQSDSATWGAASSDNVAPPAPAPVAQSAPTSY